jgi:hypothetical protein
MLVDITSPLSPMRGTGNTEVEVDVEEEVIEEEAPGRSPV